MVTSQDLYIPVSTIPRKLLERNENRWSWTISNTGAVTVYYLRGDRGANVATTGTNIGIPIAAGATDGYDDLDAQEEVWVIAGSDTVVMLGETTK